MKKLILLRHAKSSWENNLLDRDRPLSEKGVSTLNRVINGSREIFSSSDVVFVSPANRALHTASIMINLTKISFKKLIVVEALYTFNHIDIINFIKKVDNTYNQVIIVGHNPAFTSTANFFSLNKDYYMSTSSWVKIEFQTNDWTKIDKGISSFGSRKTLNLK